MFFNTKAPLISKDRWEPFPPAAIPLCHIITISPATDDFYLGVSTIILTKAEAYQTSAQMIYLTQNRVSTTAGAWLVKICVKKSSALKIKPKFEANHWIILIKLTFKSVVCTFISVSFLSCYCKKIFFLLLFIIHSVIMGLFERGVGLVLFYFACFTVKPPG